MEEAFLHKTMDPFLNAELLALRRSQRTRLACIPNWLISNGPELTPTASPEAGWDRSRVEVFVRDFAEDEWHAAPPELVQLLELGRQANTVESVRAVWRQWWNCTSSSDQQAPLENLAQRLTELATQSGTSALRADIAMKVLPPLYELIALLDLADSLADDGYRDPRLRRYQLT